LRVAVAVDEIGALADSCQVEWVGGKAAGVGLGDAVQGRLSADQFEHKQPAPLTAGADDATIAGNIEDPVAAGRYQRAEIVRLVVGELPRPVNSAVGVVERALDAEHIAIAKRKQLPVPQGADAR